MIPNYTRPEHYRFTIEDHIKEYRKRYPNGGPSSSSDCGDWNNVPNCGCWVCQYIKWKEIYYGSFTSSTGSASSVSSSSSASSSRAGIRRGFTFEDYNKEYRKRWPIGSISSSSEPDCEGKNDLDTCNCWVCCVVRWKEENLILEFELSPVIRVIR